MNNPYQKQILSHMLNLMKELLEKMIKQEREIYLKQHNSTKANGYYTRDLYTPIGVIEDLRVARTRDGKFNTTLLPYRKRYTVEFENLVYALFYAGISTRKISKVLEALYNMEISHTVASRLADVAEEEINKWKNRELDSYYPVIFIDATYFPINRSGVKKEAIYVALGIRRDGRREILGYDIGGEGESANVWKEMLNNIKMRGVEEVTLIVGDGLTGLKEAIKKVYPGARYQHCIVHAVRNTLTKVRIKDRAEIAQSLREIYKSRDIEGAREALERFSERWRKKYPKIVKWWEEREEELLAYMEFPEEIRRMIYTTNQIERLFKELKRRLKVMEQLQGEKGAEKIIYVILRELNDRYMSRKLRGFEKAIEDFLESKGASLESFQTHFT